MKLNAANPPTYSPTVRKEKLHEFTKADTLIELVSKFIYHILNSGFAFLYLLLVVYKDTTIYKWTIVFTF